MSPWLALPTSTRPTYQTDDTMPNSQVDHAGVRYFGLTSPSLGGKARWIAMESVVRAVGRIVVWQLAAAELRIAMMSSLSATVPRPELPNTTLPVVEITSSGLLARKVGPFTAWAQTVTIRKMATRMTVDRTPARPGVRLAFSLSSFTLVAVSQPQ